MSQDRIMYVCTSCADERPENCGHYDREELRVTADGRWLCDDCLDSEMPSDEASKLKPPPEYQPV